MEAQQNHYPEECSLGAPSTHPFNRINKTINKHRQSRTSRGAHQTAGQPHYSRESLLLYNSVPPGHTGTMSDIPLSPPTALDEAASTKDETSSDVMVARMFMVAGALVTGVPEGACVCVWGGGGVRCARHAAEHGVCVCVCVCVCEGGRCAHAAEPGVCVGGACGDMPSHFCRMRASTHLHAYRPPADVAMHSSVCLCLCTHTGPWRMPASLMMHASACMHPGSWHTPASLLLPACLPASACIQAYGTGLTAARSSA